VTTLILVLLVLAMCAYIVYHFIGYPKDDIDDPWR
jgi:hypothetical protein